MNLPLFLARKMKGGGVSSASNTIALISVAVSIFAMVLAISLSEGFKKEIAKRSVGFNGEILLIPPGQGFSNDRYPIEANLSYIDEISSLESVSSVEAVAYKPGMIKNDDRLRGALFKGVDSLYDLSFFEESLSQGRMPDFSGKRPSNEILISERMAALMGYKVGDKVTAYFIGEDVKARRFVISGLFDIRFEDLDEQFVLADIRHIRRLNGWSENGSSSIEVKLSGGKRDEVASQIGEIIMERDITMQDSSVAVCTVDELFPVLFDWLSLLDLNVLVVIVLMIVVAAVNMITGLLIILFEKTSMIGLLKSMGMKNRDVCLLFLYRGAQIVLRGMVWGNCIAAAVLLIQKYTHLFKLDPMNYYVDYIPVDFNLANIAVINVGAFLLISAVMVIPSLVISTISPDKSLRVE